MRIDRNIHCMTTGDVTHDTNWQRDIMLISEGKELVLTGSLKNGKKLPEMVYESLDDATDTINESIRARHNDFHPFNRYIVTISNEKQFVVRFGYGDKEKSSGNFIHEIKIRTRNA